MSFLPKKWYFNEVAGIASITGAILSVVALIWTVRPDSIPPQLKAKS